LSAEVVRVQEVADRLNCSTRKAYEIIRQLNAELSARGYITIAGRAPRSYFEQKCKLERKEV
jgi:MarR-like DNA-binding transcriptional regulator SgrR of sgrS sRNA